jgi:alkylation response protein AidB-like acyl-CoA dehydrogenase
MSQTQTPQGCSFLLTEVGTETILTPERFTSQQRDFARTAQTFMEKEVLPIAEELEHVERGQMAGVLRKAGDVGLLMIDIPEEYGGLQVDKTTSMLVTETLAQYGGFATSYGAHVGIGTLPILYFGTKEQKVRWLPKLATGELLAAYALTEPGSGSDALAAKTKAVLSEDGQHYVLNGTKMWITNAGFADIFTVFCQVDGSKFTAFVVEKDREGVSTGAEEKKMGLKGSSTRLLILENVKVPKENLLGEVGKGHKIAFNILNIGRFKLGVGVLGGSKRVMHVTTKYANERVAFGQTIGSFGAIQSKFGEMVARMYALESMSYRVAGYMDQSLEQIDATSDDYSERSMEAIEEFAIEDSIMKVYGSEVAQYVADECVQIHGGMGYSAEYEVERTYRDVRINRIFEGTNEINRMLIPGMILKRAMKGQLNLFGLIQSVEEDLSQPSSKLPPGAQEEGLALERFMVEQGKKVFAYAANQAIQKHMADLRDQQEILCLMADMIMELYAIDSAVTRTLQIIAERGLDKAKLAHSATRLACASGFNRVRQLAEELLCHLAKGDRLTPHLEALEKLTFVPRVDTITIRRELAQAALERERYPF